MSCTFATPQEVLRVIKDDEIQRIDLRFTDMLGRWRRVPVLPNELRFECFEDGIKFNGSMTGNVLDGKYADMLAIPDPASAFRDPFSDMATLVLICNIRDLAADQGNTRDPRHIAQKAEAYLNQMQIGNSAKFGVTFKKFIHNLERENQSSRFGILGSCVDPDDIALDVLLRAFSAMETIGINAQIRDEERTTAGEVEINVPFATLTRMADRVMMYRYLVENVARQRGLTTIFAPDTGLDEGRIDMCIHQSIWQGQQPLFAGDGYAGSSALMRHYFAGLLEHSQALLAICGALRSEVPHRAVDLQSGRFSPCRIPTSPGARKANRVEFHCADTKWNPYLAFSAMLMAGIDGFRNRLYNLDPDEPIGRYIPDLSLRAPEDAAPAMDARDALRADHSFLLHGDVFTPDVIMTWPGESHFGFA
jgi:glutamine synthetase